MSATTATGGTAPVMGPERHRARWLPTTLLGRWSAWLTALFFVAFIGLTQGAAAGLSRGTILDTWVAPAVMVLWIDAAAALGFMAVIRRHDRSVLAVAAFAFALAAGLFGTFMFVGDALSGPVV